jgi:RNA polymerase sigma-70 factor, ECF subfamily
MQCVSPQDHCAAEFGRQPFRDQYSMADAEDENNRASDPGGDREMEEFIAKLTDSQSNLKTYLLAALGNLDDAMEVLQRTNLVLWRNARNFRPEAEFMPWAITLAKYEIMSFYRDRGRDRHVFSEEVATLMLQTAAAELPDLTDRMMALRDCVNKLPAASQEMLRLRYGSRASIAQIAEQLNRTQDAIKSALARVRKSLEGCIDRRINSSAY